MEHKCKDLKQYYAILGLSSSATVADIKRSYKRLAMIYHPDRSDGNKEKEEHFKKIQEAYTTLSTESKRNLYDDNILDEFGNVPDTTSLFNSDDMFDKMHFQQTFVVDLNDIFMNMFGFEQTMFQSDDAYDELKNSKTNPKTTSSTYNKPPPSCQTITVDLNLDDVMYGCKRTVCSKQVETCTGCWGEGTVYGNVIRCVSCDGRGYQNSIPFPVMCTSCDGKAMIKQHPKTCELCSGNGTILVKKDYIVDVCPGQAHKSTFQLDRNVQISFRHVMSPRAFRLDKDDLWIVEYVNIEELLCGFEREIKVSSKESSVMISKNEYFDINDVMTFNEMGVTWNDRMRGPLKLKFKLQKSEQEASVKRYKKVFQRMFSPRANTNTTKRD